MTLTAEHLSPIAALIAGVLILDFAELVKLRRCVLFDRCWVVGLNGIYHFIN